MWKMRTFAVNADWAVLFGADLFSGVSCFSAAGTQGVFAATLGLYVAVPETFKAHFSGGHINF